MKRSSTYLSTLGAALLMATPLTAHDGEGLTPHHLWQAWSFDPVVIALLVASAGLYVRGVRLLWDSRSGGHVGRGIRRWEAISFAAGWLALVVALVSPLDPMGEVLFSAHMVQHEVLMLVAAPLLVLGHPMLPIVRALPRSWRRSIGRTFSSAGARGAIDLLAKPAVAWSIHALALWGWHVPSLFESATTNDLVHSLQHGSFLGSALLFYWSILHVGEERMGYGVAVLYIFTTAVHSSILGALLTFGRTSWYGVYASTTAPWGLTSLEDQQLGGLIMWVPAGVIYMGAALWLMARWLGDRATPAGLAIRGESSLALAMIDDIEPNDRRSEG